MSAKQYAQILKRCDEITKTQKQIKADIARLIATATMQGNELSMLKERIDIFCNQDFIIESRKKVT